MKKSKKKKKKKKKNEYHFDITYKKSNSNINESFYDKNQVLHMRKKKNNDETWPT